MLTITHILTSDLYSSLPYWAQDIVHDPDFIPTIMFIAICAGIYVWIRNGLVKIAKKEAEDDAFHGRKKKKVIARELEKQRRQSWLMAAGMTAVIAAVLYVILCLGLFLTTMLVLTIIAAYFVFRPWK